MKQATQDVTAPVEPQYPPNPAVCMISPHGTLNNCKDLADYLGITLACWRDTGLELDDRFGNAAALILATVSSALEWEADRVQYQRKSEAEVAAEVANAN